jgi:hypothetical protein
MLGRSSDVMLPDAWRQHVLPCIEHRTGYMLEAANMLACCYNIPCTSSQASHTISSKCNECTINKIPLKAEHAGVQ